MDCSRPPDGARRRGRVAIGGVAAAATLTVLAALLAPSMLGDPGEPDGTGTTASPSSNSLSVPGGKRLVGARGVAVAVPRTWNTGDARCGTPLSDTMYFPGDGVRSCLEERPPDTSMVLIMQAQSPWARSFKQTQPAGSVGGRLVEKTPIRQVEQTPLGHDQHGLWSGALVVEDALMIAVTSPDRDTVQIILDSLVPVRDGYTTVPVAGPWAKTRRLMEDAGLHVVIHREHRSGWSGGVVLSSNPPFGSVVVAGSTVTVTLTAGPNEVKPRG